MSEIAPEFRIVEETSIFKTDIDEVLVEHVERTEIFGIGIQGPAGPAGGITALEDDTSPTLGGDLQLNGHGVIGQLENPTFVMDGGLLG